MERWEEHPEDLASLVDMLPDRDDDGMWPVLDDYEELD
jgi:hypothetical protein